MSLVISEPQLAGRETFTPVSVLCYSGVVYSHPKILQQLVIPRPQVYTFPPAGTCSLAAGNEQSADGSFIALLLPSLACSFQKHKVHMVKCLLVPRSGRAIILAGGVSCRGPHG